MSNYYRTEIEIWAGFGPIGKTEKKNLADYEQLLRVVFFMGKTKFKIFKKYYSVCTKKLLKMKVIFFLKNLTMNFK